MRKRAHRAAEKMKQFLQHLQLSKVLGVLMALIIVACVSVTAFLPYQSYKQILVEQVAASRNDVLVQISAKVGFIQQSMVNVSDLYHAPVASFTARNSAQERQARLQRLTSAYQNVLVTLDPKCYVMVLGEDGFFYTSRSLGTRDPRLELWYIRIPTTMAEGEFYWTQSHRDADGAYSFSLARRVKGPDGGEYTILISVPERAIYEVYENVITNNALYVVRKDGHIVSQNDPKMVDLNYFNMSRLDELVGSGRYKVVEKSGIQVLLSRYNDEDYDLVYIEEIPLANLLDPLRSVQYVTIGTAVVMVLLACLVVLLTVRTLSRPLSQLCQRLTQVSSGDFNTRFDIQSWEEINVINNVSQEMTHKISTLFEDLKAQEKAKSLAEVEFLQAQINPHFMYNTLFSIQCLVSLGENETAQRMLENFIGMLRTVLESKEEIITLQQELYTLQQYFVVLQCRYGDDIHLELDIPEELLPCRVLKFILQPIVENSIFHGLEPTGGRGVVTVRGWTEEEHMLLEIWDNGAGMDPDSLRALTDSLTAAPAEHAGTSVGIRNVYQRIKLHFGEGCGLTIASEKGRGTQVRLILPLLPPDR